MIALLSMNTYCKSWKWNKVATVNYKSLNYEHVLFLLFWWFQRNQHEIWLFIYMQSLAMISFNISTIWSIIVLQKYISRNTNIIIFLPLSKNFTKVKIFRFALLILNYSFYRSVTVIAYFAHDLNLTSCKITQFEK